MDNRSSRADREIRTIIVPDQVHQIIPHVDSDDQLIGVQLHQLGLSLYVVLIWRIPAGPSVNYLHVPAWKPVVQQLFQRIWKTLVIRALTRRLRIANRNNSI